jgi:hypothetical protein
MLLIVEIASGVVLGLFAFFILPQFLKEFWSALNDWQNNRRWWRSYKRHESGIRQLSRRYSRHLLKEAGIRVPIMADPLDIFVPIDGGESKFDPVMAAALDRLANETDALR